MKINGFEWVPSIVSLILTIIIVLILSIVYFVKIKKYKVGEITTGYCLLVELFIGWCRKSVLELAGKKAKWLAPYFGFLIIYISINNLVALLGLTTIISQLTVPLALGSITFLGLFVMAIKYRNKNFFKQYLNPFQWFMQFSPFISISFRLFGNIFSGVLIISLFYSITNILWDYIPIIGQINILGGFLAPPFHFYFDIFAGILQSYVFAILTISYWGTIMNENSEKKEIKIKNIKKNTKSSNNLLQVI